MAFASSSTTLLPNQPATSTQATQQPHSDIAKSMDEELNEPLRTIDTSLFDCLQDIDLDALSGKNVSVVLPYIVKLLLNPYFTRRKQALKLIFHLRKANDVVQLLKTKIIEPQDLCLGTQIQLDPGSFESASPDARIKLVALEYIRIQEIARQSNLNANQNTKLQVSTLFDNPLYVNDIILCFFALLNKANTIPVMNILDVSEALLHVKYGPTYIVRLVANMPERCQEVCHSLITFGEKQDECEKINEISYQRAKTLRALCQLNPSMAFTVRSFTLQMGKMPSLTIMITLDRLIKSMDRYNAVRESQVTNDNESMNTADRVRLAEAMIELDNSYDSSIAFITGILLGVDEGTRVWFSQYIKSAQQKRIDQSHHTILSVFRSVLLTYVQKMFPYFLEAEYPDEESLNQFKTSESETKDRLLNRRLIQVTATLRVYCALRGIGMLKLNHDESETLLRLVTCRQIASQTSINLATTGVCTLLVCSSMINNQKDEKRAAEWLKWLIKESHYSDDSYSSHGRCSISELLLLIAIHFQNNQTNQIAELVHATLGLKLQTKASVSKCKSLFVQEVFTDQMIAEHAVRVPVTKGLDNTINEFLPIHCIHQLLECRSFSKHQVPIKDWIFKQICESKKPIHHMLPKLIEAYVNSVIISTSAHGHCGTNQPIPENDIMKIFQTRLYSLDGGEGGVMRDAIFNGNRSPTSEDMRRKNSKKSKIEVEGQPMEICEDATSNDATGELTELHIADIEVAQILLLYYLMLYEDVRLRKNGDLPATEKAKLIRYSPEFMMDIPVFYLLQLVRDNQDQFGTILPPILRLVATQYPHLCSTQHWLNTAEHYEPYKSKDVNSAMLIQRAGSSHLFNKSFSKRNMGDSAPRALTKYEILTQLLSGFEFVEDEPLKLARTMSNILIMPRDEIWMFVGVFIKNWTKILHLRRGDEPEQAKLIQLTTKLWWKFNTVFPRKLWVMTINSLRMVQNGLKVGSIKSLEYYWDDLAIDPLIVLRCDSQVYRCPEYLNIMLHILTGFLAASRRCLQDQISDQLSRQKDAGRDRNLEELKTTLVLAQTSAAIQILLESCIPSEEEQELFDKRDSKLELTKEEQIVLDRFEISVACMCEHLHQVFIADTNLAKLVHFQTYPSELLATTCEKIPSMHICLDFIPELLSQPDLAKQVFVIELTSHLCEKYAITKSLNVAKLCFNVAYTLLQLLPSDKRAQFYIPALPALLRICEVFPILQEDARIILNQINQITLTHVASTSSRLSLGTARPFEGLDRLSWLQVKKQMNSLSSPEALYLCIQKCLLDLDRMEEKDKQQMQQLITHIGPDKLPQPAYNTIFAYGSHVTNY